ncbi:MAG: hypothetical protein OZSIB_3506 [Candidatus Ozemobacter sibiricus]|uniref:Uncharacterized protein n=1 Tax=Candidatus Ozemobacter sibiricus TaxID=2268124 RepID=A0A367ZQA0_9BACT|nr:MAG: hypothetical protein OZSIB_3506 [Candidatus Ozemobacter sibiricus]
MKRGRSTHGVAFPVVLVLIIVVAGFIISLSSLQQGLKSQVYHSSNHQWSFLLAYSAMSKVLAQIHSSSWAHRPFAARPYRESGVPLQGGTYDLFVENTPGRDFQADIYVKTTLTGVSRLYFWRITYNDDLLDVSNRIIVEFFKTGEPRDFPTAAGPSDFSKMVDDLLAERARNQKPSDELAVQLAPLSDPKAVLAALKGRTPETFTKSWPTDPTEATLTDKPAASFPLIPPLGTAEVPTADGPGPGVSIGGGGSPTSGSPGFPDIPSSSEFARRDLTTLNQSMKAAADAAKEANAKYNQGKDIVDATPGNWEGAKADLQAANNARLEAIKNMNEAVTLAKDALQDTTSAEEAKALEEMVSASMVAAYANLANGIARVYEDFANGAAIVGHATTSDQAQAILNSWTNSLASLEQIQSEMNSVMNEIEGFAKTPEVVAAQEAAAQALAKTEEMVKAAIEAAKARVEELKAQEEAAAAAAAAANEAQPADGGGTP